jgi:HK97 family phage major capsid protein
MVSSDPALGGYTIPEDFKLPVLDLAPEQPHMMQRCTVIPAPTGEVTMPKSVQTDGDEYGGMTGAWIAEAGLKPATDTSFEQVKIAAHEYAMYTEVSHRLLSRSPIAMENWILTKGRQKVMEELDNVIANGDGTGKPLGILNTAGIRTQTRVAANAIGNTDIVNLKYQLLPQHRAKGVFIANDGALQSIELLEDTQNRPLFKSAIANGPDTMMAGYPYFSTTRTPNLGTTGDLMFVDLSEYYVAMEQDIVVRRSDDFKFQNNVASFAIYVVVGGRLVQPRVASVLDAAVTV